MTPETLADLSARAYRHMQPWTAEQFAQTLASPHTVLAHTAHAYVLGRVIVDEAEILALAADPDFQRQGHAARALKQFHTSAQTRGATQIFLEVAARNIGARTFYQGQGYSESGLRKNYYIAPDGNPDDAVIMTRALPSRHAAQCGGAAKTG